MSGGRDTFLGATRQHRASWRRRAVVLFRALLLFVTWFALRTAHADESAVSVRGESTTHAQPGDAPLLPTTSRSLSPPPDGYNTHDGGWVKFSYHPSVIDKVQPLIEEADGFKADIRQRLGQDVLEHVEIRVARTPREMRS